MKIGMKLILIISAVNLVGNGVLTIAASMLSSNAIADVADRNARNITAVTAGSVKSFLEIPLDEIRAFVHDNRYRNHFSGGRLAEYAQFFTYKHNCGKSGLDRHMGCF